MKLKQSMDIFGEALLDYLKGDKGVFYLKDEKGEKHIYNLSERFRSYSKLNKSEKKLISLAKGNILYVGCGTGNIIPFLEKKGIVSGIDISPKVVEVAKSRGHKNCSVEDIFTFKTKNKFDSIVLFGNDLGIGGTISKTRELLRILGGFLKKDAQILAIIRNYSKGDYKEMKLIPIWKGKSGPNFNWILFNKSFVAELCKKQNLKMSIVSESWKYITLKITR